MDTIVKTIDEINAKLIEDAALVLYFSSPSCSVCQVLRPKVMHALATAYPAMGRYHADLALYPELAAHFQVFSAPTLIVFFQGREFIRKGRAVSVAGLLQEIKRPYELMMS